MINVPKMPEEYKGKITTECGYTKTKPRRWTAKELEWCKNLKAQGYNSSDIAKSTERSEESIKRKLKRLLIADGRYNESHRDEKYETNYNFLNHIKPVSLLDVYAGEESYYTNKIKVLCSNDKNPDAKTPYHLDALKFLCLLYYQGQKFDVIDLDPYGSAYECFDLAIKMARKGLIITLGEMGHKRFRRLDFIRSHYGISKFEDFTSENLVKHIQQIGIQNKKELKVTHLKNWRNIARVYFEIKPHKITEQWK